MVVLGAPQSTTGTAFDYTRSNGYTHKYIYIIIDMHCTKPNAMITSDWFLI